MSGKKMTKETSINPKHTQIFMPSKLTAANKNGSSIKTIMG